MKSFQLVGLIIAILLVGYVGICAVLPSRVEVALQQQVFARPEAVFYQLVCFNRWENWLAQKRLAPDTKFTYEGKDCWIGAEVKLESMTFGTEIFLLDTLQSNKSVLVLGQSSLFGRGELHYRIDSVGKTSMVNLKYTSAEISFLKRPMVKLSMGSVDETLRLSLNGLKRESELNLLKEVKPYEFECPIEKVTLEGFELVEFSDTVAQTGFSNFISNSMQQLSNLESEKGVKLGKVHFVGVEELDEDVYRISLARKLLQPVSVKITTVRKVEKSNVLVCVLTENLVADQVNKAMDAYILDFNLNKSCNHWYEFDSAIEMHMQPDRIVYPISLGN